MTATVIKIEASVNAPVKKVWDFWTGSEHIVKWNSPSPEWHTPWAEQDLKVGGKFKFRMEARDGSMGFDLPGRYDVVKPEDRLEYTLDDNRKVQVSFESKGNETHVVQHFEAEKVNPEEQQRAGWQAILDSFKKYTEAN